MQGPVFNCPRILVDVKCGETIVGRKGYGVSMQYNESENKGKAIMATFGVNKMAQVAECFIDYSC